MEMMPIKEDVERIIGTRQLEAGETMSQVLARLDGYAGRGDLPERLQHYLSKRSYVKALAWIEDPSTPHRV